MQSTEFKIMRDEDSRQKKAVASAKQIKALIVLTVIQFLCSAINLSFLAIKIISGVHLLPLSVVTVIIYAVFYLNFCKFTGALAEQGIIVKWVKTVKIISPLIYLPSMIVSALLMS